LLFMYILSGSDSFVTLRAFNKWENKSRRFADQRNHSYYDGPIYSVIQTKQVLNNGPTYVHIILYSFHKILYNFLAKVKANKYNVFTIDALRYMYGTFYKKHYRIYLSEAW